MSVNYKKRRHNNKHPSGGQWTSSMVRPSSSLTRSLAAQSLRVSDVQPDGNCLFRSLSSLMDGVDHVQLRLLLVQYVRDNVETFEQDVLASGYGSVSDYCSIMERNGEWGDAILLQAFIMLTKINIRLFTEYGFSDLNPGGSQNIALVRESNHYQPALPIN